MATTPTADKARKQLERLTEGKRSANGPGAHVYRFLAQHFTATDIAFVDLAIDWERTTPTSRSGRIFLVTKTAIAFVVYENAPDEAAGEPGQDFGRVAVTMYPLSGAVESMHWAAGSLSGPVGPSGQVSSWLDAKSMTVTGHGWSIELPAERTADGNGYFERLRAAVLPR